MSKRKQPEPEDNILLESRDGFLEIKDWGDGRYRFCVGNTGAYMWRYIGTPEELIDFLTRAASNLWEMEVNTLMNEDWGPGIIELRNIRPPPLWNPRLAPLEQLDDYSWQGFYEMIDGIDDQLHRAVDIHFPPEELMHRAKPEELSGQWYWVVRDLRKDA